MIHRTVPPRLFPTSYARSVTFRAWEHAIIRKVGTGSLYFLLQWDSLWNFPLSNLEEPEEKRYEWKRLQIINRSSSHLRDNQDEPLTQTRAHRWTHLSTLEISSNSWDFSPLKTKLVQFQKRKATSTDSDSKGRRMLRFVFFQTDFRPIYPRHAR